MRRTTLAIFVTGAICGIFSLLFVNLSLAAEPYVIGFIADITGPARANYAPEAEGCRLYFDDLNDRGGINGHPIKLIIEDGQSEPAKSAAVAKKLIEMDNALALLGLGFTRAQPPVVEMAKKIGVAVVAGYSEITEVWSVQPGDPIFATGLAMHPLLHTGGYMSAKVVEETQPKGASLGFSAFTLPAARVWTDWAREWCEKWGYKTVYYDHIPPGTVDVSPWANKMARTNPKALVCAYGSVIMFPLIMSLEKMGYTNDIIFPDFVPEGDVVKIVSKMKGSAEHLIWSGRYASAYEAGNIPEMGKILDAMKKYESKYPLSARHCQGWTMGRLVEAALRKAGWPCDRRGLISALETTELDTRGLTGGPIRFTPTNHFGPSWFKAYRWNDNQKALMPITGWFKAETEKLAKSQ